MRSEGAVSTTVCIPDEDIVKDQPTSTSLEVPELVIHTDHAYQNVPVDVKISEPACPNHEILKHGQLFRDVYEFSELNSRLDQVEQYFDLYFQQTSQDCTTPESVQKITELQEKCQKTQYEVHFSLSQLKISVRPRRLLTAKVLNQLRCSQLQLIVNDILDNVQSLNNILMQALMERDELHLEHGAKLTNLDDLLAYLKELCIRVSIRRYRRQNALDYTENNFVPEVKNKPVRSPSDCFEKSNKASSVKTRRTMSNPNQFWGTKSCSQLTLKQRLVKVFTRQSSTTC
ncbi:hypothetical protein FBUS_02822 [Fasciolopsis buskii]|uniref:Schwannomin interacting protein 1 C-terminal domain-containing protein n=1 Tax=Fasciolopsis buskii TaxID=27845 RepID=A0A8E0RTP5_9TREM|nr:hypothetical protein FBUS_02822 [Fasciolopsis buski]